MASYHLSVETISRGRGQSAVASAAYRAGERLRCEREGVTHDYTLKSGIEAAFILTPQTAPIWATDRNALWNAAEASERRKNSTVAREWRLALPVELTLEQRIDLAAAFARELIERFCVVVDIAIHAPHRSGDERNWHAHLLTTTRMVGEDGFGAKTRILDAAQTGGAEIRSMRAFWAEVQNSALQSAEIDVSVDHRSLEDQRDAALERGDQVLADTLNRPPEPRMGVAATNIERKAKQAALVAGEDYVPVTDRGALLDEVRAHRKKLEAGSASDLI